jgi:predicted PolB exonuclease-like 3'-5' exonuclease
MLKENIEAFLRKKIGWVKKSPVLLSERLSTIGINADIKLIIEAQKTVRKELKQKPSDDHITGRLFYDIETTPNVVLSWRVGNKVNLTPDNIIQERKIICISWKWENSKDTFCIHWDDDQCDKKMLEEFVEVLHQATETIGHNSDNYDMKWIRTRCLFHGIPVSPNIKQVDTLKIARKMFYLNSNKLDYISKFLGHEGKLSTEYGMWKNILLKNDRNDLARMVTYCKQDVIELERVFKEIRNYSKPTTHFGVVDNNDKCSCSECSSKKLKYHRKLITNRGTLSYELLCEDCGTFTVFSNTDYTKRMKWIH